jgi:hypothetical protein
MISCAGNPALNYVRPMSQRKPKEKMYLFITLFGFLT